MFRSIASFVICFGFAFSCFSQKLFMPRDVQAAFLKGTRQGDGRPGKTYWQNTARYRMQITALPPDRTIRGRETITYINNSPDTLDRLLFKLLLNIHKPGAPRDYPPNTDYLTDGVHVDSFGIEGQQAFQGEPNVFTNAYTNAGTALEKPLLPHDSIRIAVNWHFTLSLQSGREGMIDSTTYFLAYFYPRIVVYDDVSGWDRMPFKDSHEFYSDFNDYDVTIESPKNYIVWGTGTLQTAKEVLQPAFFSRLDSSFRTDGTVHVATTTEIKSGAVTTQKPTQRWRFTATHIPDMAFAISDHYAWDAGSVSVDSSSGRRASVQAAYNDTALDFRSMVAFGQHALNWFSNHLPGISYPYEKSTIVQGYAGMEYPMMVNDESYKDTSFSRFVAEHEIAHTYMPFYMGINETRYGFMDEGWATTFEHLIGLEDLGTEKAVTAYQQFRVALWIGDKSAEEQIPIITPGDALSGFGLGNNQYGKASLGYLAVKDLLGDAAFKKCLQEYMHRWNGKHPIPWDFFNTFNNASGKDLNWFWNSWFFSTGYIDLGIMSVTKSGAGTQVVLENIGGMPAPVDLIIKYRSGSTVIKHLSPSIWEKNIHRATVSIPTKTGIESVSLEGGIFMDSDTANNKKS